MRYEHCDHQALGSGYLAVEKISISFCARARMMAVPNLFARRTGSATLPAQARLQNTGLGSNARLKSRWF
jgi:hypothetical protein